MIGSDGREIYRVVWPRGAKTVQATDVAPRLGTLDGKVIGQLWDDLFRGDEIFPILEEELTRRFPTVRFVRYDTFGNAINSVTYTDIGIILRVTPFVTADGMVQMIVAPETSALSASFAATYRKG